MPRSRTAGTIAGTPRETDTPRPLQHDLHPRRPGARSDHRRDHHAHLPDVHLRAAGARTPQGLRVRAHAEPHARGARSQRGRDRGRPRGRSRSRRAWPRSAPSRPCSKSGDHVVVTDNTYGGTFRLFDKVLLRYGLDVQLRGHLGSRRRRAGDHAADAAAVRRDADQPGDDASPTSRGAAALAHAHDIRLAVDNTFASPSLQRPIALRRRPRGAQHDEVPQRPQRQHRRHRRRRRARTTSSG